MHEMKRFAAVTALVIGSLATAGVTAASASDVTRDGERASCAKTKIWLNDDWGCVISYGDRMKVADDTWDGNGTRLRWTSSLPNSHGKFKGSCKDYNGSENGSEECDYQFPEGTTINYKLEQISGGEVVDETDGWVQAVV
ncbi:hypothetical protein BS330_11185 [Amycolatopsis keratiniphila subsp. nogabecina]|uniref:Secreted protein n=2 Tax=Amycolatopsis TaxID=1813 RepID=A0A1W2LW37_9PSEU|nr:hypothetical protein BS330_11185 [Amycolatopsis keratiniphila subsp. nogabecina]ONF70715.1 hypothetical protein AVR91_0213895 [Amycolatopsis keratiniphila subsp. keratiniphila]SDU01680.1 hypothetical protein SAMN04489733_0416 [Amycolatopsis keratiniphila]